VIVELLLSAVVTFGPSEKDKCIHVIKEKELASCCFLSNQIMLLSYSNGVIAKWDISSKTSLTSMQLDATSLYSLVVRTDQTIVGVRNGSEIVRINPSNGRIDVIKKLSHKAARVVLTPDMTHVYSAWNDGVIRCHELSSGKETAAFRPNLFSPTARAVDISVSHDAELVAACYSGLTNSVDDSVYIWNAKMNKQVASFAVNSLYLQCTIVLSATQPLIGGSRKGQ
jgi:hypothetical protein